MSYTKPKLTDKYSAIDGITKPDRNFRDCDLGGQFYSPAEEAIRPDILKLFNLSEEEFRIWHKARLNAVTNIYHDWLLFASVPCLHYGKDQHGMKAKTSVRDIIEYLEEANDYLEKLWQYRKAWRVSEEIK